MQHTAIMYTEPLSHILAWYSTIHPCTSPPLSAEATVVSSMKANVRNRSVKCPCNVALVNVLTRTYVCTYKHTYIHMYLPIWHHIYVRMYVRMCILRTCYVRIYITHTHAQCTCNSRPHMDTSVLSGVFNVS